MTQSSRHAVKWIESTSNIESLNCAPALRQDGTGLPHCRRQSAGTSLRYYEKTQSVC